MRVKRIAVLVILTAAAVIYAQDVAQIFNELKAKADAAPAPAAAPEVRAIPVPAAVEPPAAPEVKAVSAPAAVEPIPAVVETSAQTAVAAKPAVAPDSDIQNVAIIREPSSGSIKGGLISLALKEVELNSVIRLFATLSDANIIVPTLEGATGAVKVDVNLKNVEWKPALQAILDAHSLELYEKVPGTEVYSVRKKPADAPPVMNVKIFKLDYASVSNVNDMISSMVPKTGTAAGKISIYPARNTIVVQSTPENLMEIQTMITAVDLPRQQVFIEAKFMELTDSASKQLGIDWRMLGGSKNENGGYRLGSSLNGSYDFNDSKIDGIDKTQTDNRSTSFSSAENRYTDIAGRPYENLTATPGSAAIDYPARPGSFGPNDTRSFGVTPTVKTTTLADSLSQSLSKITSLDQSTVTRALGATLNADDFNLVLAALKEINGIKIVSNPKIIVANEETAQIYIGQKEPNIKQSTTQAQQADAVTTYNLDPDRPFFEYGIKLDVTPVVNTASNISVTIAPSLSRWVKDKTVGNGGTINTFPVTDEKTIKTVFALESGQTAAIGGLTELTTNDTERKIPLLGSIPLIGRLFSYSDKQNKQVETVIFVTVGLANPANIDMETGLPQESTLAMRYDAKARSDRQIKTQEQKLLDQHESERAQSAVKKLQDAEQKRLDKKKK